RALYQQMAMGRIWNGVVPSEALYQQMA
ncbi:hypothetical protein A2U01_0034751, partial [Trifolium medium]|nr:hypothetical protein [Trifolium medium]